MASKCDRIEEHGARLRVRGRRTRWRWGVADGGLPSSAGTARRESPVSTGGAVDSPGQVTRLKIFTSDRIAVDGRMQR